jgi:hypothetical protein
MQFARNKEENGSLVHEKFTQCASTINQTSAAIFAEHHI